ncbi:MAG: hypothetical protein HYZ89_02880 [Candidatus Omnitrophica bacterium]|nr:hypothetical protein [Candidatus Omnitrophota bacterium]
MKDMIFPYQTLRGNLNLSVSQLRVDDAPVGAGLVLPDTRILNLFDVGLASWRHISLEVAVLAEPRFLEEFENSHGAVTATVVALCRPTNNRQTIRLQRNESESGRWVGLVELHRDNFSGRVELRAILAATVDGIACRPVGFADDWSVHFDEPASLRLKGTLPVRWRDFKHEEAGPLAGQFSDSTHVVDLSKSVPEVLLNSSFEGLEALLRDRKDRGAVEQVMHDMQRMSVARSVWMALLADALTAVKPGEEGEEPDWPDAEWQAEILRRVLPEIDRTKSERELLRMAAEEWRTHPGSAELLSRAEAIIGDVIGVNKSLRKSIQTLVREGVGA